MKKFLLPFVMSQVMLIGLALIGLGIMVKNGGNIHLAIAVGLPLIGLAIQVTAGMLWKIIGGLAKLNPQE